MTARPDSPTDLLDLYLDGMLSGEDLHTFERLLESDPELRVQLDQAVAVEQGLKRTFAAPHVAMPDERAAAPAPIKISSWRNRVMLIAATIMLTLGLGLIVMNLLPPPKQPVRQLAPDAVYQSLVDAGFKPHFVCTTDEEFSSTVRQQFGQPLLVGSSSNVTLLGWAYGSGYSGQTLSDKTLILMATVDGVETLMLMDNLENDKNLTIKAASGLHLHKRILGDLVLYEVTPSETPTLLQRAYNPDVQNQE